LEHW